MSGSHLSDTTRRVGPAWQRAVAAWLPCAALLKCIKCTVGTARRRPNNAVLTGHSDRLSEIADVASPRLAPSRLRRHHWPKPRHCRVRIQTSSGHPTSSRASFTVSVARALDSPFFIRGASSSPSPPSSPSQDRRRPP
jgi:hypothetical protein